ncbi:hypothetical protein D2962_09460 [Biomaibacter acetigenes]|uniref:Uncharacterized protein n=2 Tax=Biomaibacter acetigenes TaxID=2316383 RepID=A0A3G2R5Y5_9FIRM|nr:hypothetical protein D2962_09460 [Biomaibacter acetigenes]
MREAIRQHLINQIPEIKGCFEPHAATAKTQKPYLIIRQGMDTEETPWTGFRRIIEVWPYVSRTTFINVDTLAEKVIRALDGQLLTTQAGEVFTCHYLGTAGDDFVDEDWDAITRGLRFAVMALQPVTVPETVADDPWLDKLALWTANVMGVDWTIYRNFWPLGYKRPAVMWRITNIEVREKGTAMFEVRKRFTGHILGRTPNEQIAGVMTILQEMGNAIKIPLDTMSRKYMTISNMASNMQQDAITAGQISLILARNTNRPAEDAPLIMGVHNSGFIND